MFELTSNCKLEDHAYETETKPTHSYAKIAVVASSGFSILSSIVCFVLLTVNYSPNTYLTPVIPSMNQQSTIGILSICCSVIIMLSAIGGLIIIVIKAPSVGIGVYCIALTLSAITLIVTLSMVGHTKSEIESGLENTLTKSLMRYGAHVDNTLYATWNLMQRDLKCCGIRTNQATDNYMNTPWYENESQVSPEKRRKIPESCCRPHLSSDYSKLEQCQVMLPAIPSQNEYMNPVGCFESIRENLDGESGMQLAALSSLLVLCLATLACTIYSLYLSRQTNNNSRCAK